jgi:hypothetical protein
MAADARATSAFKTGDEIAKERGLAVGRADHIEAVGPVEGDLVVGPVMPLAAAKAAWDNYLAFRDTILSDPACYDMIAGRREMNRTGATRLAVPFGLSIEERDVHDERVDLADSNEYDHRYIVRVRVGRGQRWVDGIGSCRLSEIAEESKKGEPVPLGQREHFALTRAWTRAAKRAIADLLGGTEAD